MFVNINNYLILDWFNFTHTNEEAFKDDQGEKDRDEL